MDVKIPAEKATTIIQSLLKAQGGLAAMATGTVPGIVKTWSNAGVSLYISTDSPLYQSLVKQGVLKP